MNALYRFGDLLREILLLVSISFPTEIYVKWSVEMISRSKVITLFGGSETLVQSLVNISCNFFQYISFCL